MKATIEHICRDRGRMPRWAKTQQDRDVVVWWRALAKDPCSYCGGKKSMEVDHINPARWGGSNLWENLTAACKSCNSAKRDRPFVPFVMRVMSRRKTS